MEDLLQLQLLARQQRTPYAVATIVEATGSTPRTEGKMLVYADGRSAGTIGGGLAELRAKKDAADAIRCGKNRLVRYEVVPQAAASGMVCGGTLQVFIEVYGTRPLLVVCGGGHVGTCVLRAAKLTGFELWLFDDRPQEAVAEAAALADRNVERFALYLRNLCDKTQFIVITHRRGTMEASDVLYGVTMQEQGVSKILHIRLGEMEQQLGITG